MSQVINLRQARKRKTRDAKARKAAERRRQFGRSKAEKAKNTQERERAATQLEGHRLATHPDSPDAEDES